MNKILKIAFLSERGKWQDVFDFFVAKQEVELSKLDVRLEVTKLGSCEAYNNVKRANRINFHILFFEGAPSDNGKIYFADVVSDLKVNFPDIYLVGVTGSDFCAQLCRNSGVDEVVCNFLENYGAGDILCKFAKKYELT